MPLAAGTRLGNYEIVGPLGAGGMGEVYRACDNKLKRDVALKVLSEAFAGNPERMARFQREAEVLASLNHPNIAQIYGVEENALVMELVEGENLKGPLPVDAAMNYAHQIAEALEAAHEKGIIHRDLKPANVMVTPAGVVKVLDFGLAKAAEGRVRASDPSISPTLAMSTTYAGMIMGTAAYMSPGQAHGRVADRRADIWSFGAVLYEMLSGKLAFPGETVSDTMAAVLKSEPDWSTLPAGTPANIRKLLRQCLTKDRTQRLQAIGDARIALDEKVDDPPLAPARSRGILPWAIAGALLLSTLVVSVVAYRRAPDETRVLKLSVPLPEKAALDIDILSAAPSPPAVSPDGRRIAAGINVAGQNGLWVRDLDSLTGRILPGTEGASFPFWSPDSHFIAFFAGGKLKKLDMAGGPALALCDAVDGRGGAWSKKDVIVFAPTPNTGIFRVPAAGGTATPVTALDQGWGMWAHRYPWFLPDARHFLYTARNIDSEKTRVYVADIASKNQREVLGVNSNAVYATPGYLLFLLDRTIGSVTEEVAAQVAALAKFTGRTKANLTVGGLWELAAKAKEVETVCTTSRPSTRTRNRLWMR